MKNGKLILAALIIVALVIGAVLFFEKDKKANKKTEQITIEFDSDGGSKVESKKIDKNSSITLPTTTKDGFNFIGWYNDTTMVTNETKFTSNTKLTAKWDKIPEDAKTFTIVFDTKGGNEINGLTLECDKEIKLPSNPTRKDYKFISWQDKNGKVITDGALLACEDITLTAVWKEEKKDSNSNESNSNSNKQITYTCDKGYTLEGKLCKKTVDAELKCLGDSTEYGDGCVVINSKGMKAPQEKTDAEGNKSYFCASKEYIYIENPAGIESENGGCFPKTPKAAYCAQGELNSGKCYIEVNAKISK